MSTPANGKGLGKAQTPEQIEAEIAAQRERLADTVDQLTAKLDVKSRAQRRAADMKSRAQRRAIDVRSQAPQRVADLKDRATTDTGSPRPEVLAAAGSLVAMAIALVWWRRHHH